MTNGEKIQAVFPYIEMWGESKDTLDYSLGGMIHRITKSWWNAEYKEPSSSGKPNKSIEEKCPCYYCEHFEIKGLSHCKIHEDAYGDSRCNDYHKINQKPNKSEIPTGSTTKNDLAVDCISREQALRELKKSAEHHANDSREEALLRRDRDIIRALPPVTPTQKWIPVNEKLPNDRDWYLGIFKEPDTGWIIPLPFICDYVGHETKATTKEHWILRGFTDRDEHIDYYFNLVCVAWMPLPKPYKAESEG